MYLRQSGANDELLFKTSGSNLVVYQFPVSGEGRTTRDAPATRCRAAMQERRQKRANFSIAAKR